jgi:hypothetical protein
MLPADYLEHFLRLLNGIQAQKVLTYENCAPTIGSHAPAGNHSAAEVRREDLLKLSRWPWSMMGKEVRVQEEE